MLAISPKLPHLILPFLLFLFIFALASLFALRTPPWQAPDEPAHYAYVQHVAETGSPPILVAPCYNEAYKNELVSHNFTQEIDFARFCYEGHQPPLFYYLAAPVYLLSGGSLLALRLFCALLGSAVVIVAWQIVHRAGGDKRLALATAALVGLVPQYLAIIGSLNNDALTFFIVAMVAWQLIALLKPVEGARRGVNNQLGDWVRLALLVALALFTKTLAWVVLPLVGVTMLMKGKQGSPRKPLIIRGLLVGFIVLLFIVPWFARNMLVYGGVDVLGLGRHDEIAVGQPRTVDEMAVRGLWGTIINGLQTTFHSFWGQFGWMKAPLQSYEYQLLGIFSLAALAGVLIWLMRRGWRAWRIDGRVLLLFLLWIATNATLLLYYNLEFVQYQGRYLFSSLIPLAFFMMIGLAAWLPRRWAALPWGVLLLYLLYLDYLAIMERLPGMMNY